MKEREQDGLTSIGDIFSNLDAGPILAPWKAEQHAKAKLIEAGAEADSLRLIAAGQTEARRRGGAGRNRISPR